MRTRTVWFCEVPHFLVDYGLSAAELKPAFFVVADDTGRENVFVAGSLDDCSSDFIGQLADLNHTKSFLINLNSDTDAWDRLDKSADDKIADFMSSFFLGL